VKLSVVVAPAVAVVGDTVSVPEPSAALVIA
jgi:hypothetical protein